MILPKTNKKKIFVTTGSSLDFDFLVKEVDKINASNLYSIIIQNGNGKYIPKNCIFFKYDKSLDKYFDWADLVITHTGAGTLFELLEKNKKTIVISNPDAISNHELAIKFSKFKFCVFIPYIKINLLKSKLLFIFNNKVKFNKYKLNTHTIGSEIISFIKGV